ncbi:MAG: glycoside hydrolase family 43 protein [Caldilineaceae bacterium]|nr:glycoside hydrolase family 43 protein [Caldilineaceae bacterium]
MSHLTNHALLSTVWSGTRRTHPSFSSLIVFCVAILLVGCNGGLSPRATLGAYKNSALKAIFPPPLIVQQEAGRGEYPSLADFWAGDAEFVVDVEETGLPMGESDTILMRDGQLWSYVHASDRSAGVVDQCGEPVEFPGCTVIYKSDDGGQSFALDDPPVCQFKCTQCPCNSQYDHIDQQQYPRVFFDGDRMHTVYEYRGMIMHRSTEDGSDWSHPEFVPLSGIWEEWYRSCQDEARIGLHPNVEPFYDCLVGGPPGVYVEDDQLYIFVALGQNPGSLGCYVGAVNGPIASLRFCRNNPLLTGALAYGPLAEKDASANPHFDFRTVSSADVHKIGDRYYMLFEGVRGPGPGDPGDTQFGLGLARSLTDQIDGPWETFPDNPILVDLPGNIGLGHADLVVLEDQSYLYTSLDGEVRSRLVLAWRDR